MWAQANGITCTPAFVFNNRFLMVGAQDYEVFADVARRLLSKEGA
jgi:predicted DsbA family dithiol-disulfide isomerase